jgi:hypothetical protein
MASAAFPAPNGPYRADRDGHIRDTRELAPSATIALRLVRNHMKLRRPDVRIEDERRNPVSFFQLKEMAELEARKNTSRT